MQGMIMKKTIPPNNFIKIFFTTAILLLLVCGALVIIFDPFYHYHKPLPHLKAVLNEKEYQVPGTLRHFDYDAVIAGSSVAENNNNKWFDEAFGCRSVKAIRSYGATADLCYYLNEAFEAKKLKYVFFNIDPSSLNADTETTFEAVGAPMYLYDKNPLNDVNYLFNKDVIFERIPYMLANSFIGEYDEGESYNWAQWKSFDEETILYHYIRKPNTEPMKNSNEYFDICDENVALLKEMIEAHPETEFYFFIPPYSILWFDMLYRSGDTAAYLEMEKRALLLLIDYENVKLYNFQNAENIIYNLDNYTDSLHFSPEINRYMCECLKNGTYSLNTSNDIEKAFEDIAAMAFSASDYVTQNYGDRVKVDIY